MDSRLAMPPVPAPQWYRSYVLGAVLEAVLQPFADAEQHRGEGDEDHGRGDEDLRSVLPSARRGESRVATDLLQDEGDRRSERPQRRRSLALRSICWSRDDQVIENLALRQQVPALK